MKRRNFLLAAGVVATLPLAALVAQDVWHRVATAYPPSGGLGEAQLALVSAVADTVIPRTDIPGATDVGVPAWVNVIVTGYYTSAERAVFLGGLDEIDALALAVNDKPLAMNSSEQRERVIAILDRPSAYERFVTRHGRSRRFAQLMMPLAQRARAYAQLKELVVHGYFTSERVHGEVLMGAHMPGYFDGAAMMPASARGHGK